VSILFALHTGARAGEQLACSGATWTSSVGWWCFGAAPHGAWSGRPRGGRERRVPLSASLEAALKRIRHLRSKLVFCNENGSALKIDQLHERLWARAGGREFARSGGTICGIMPSPGYAELSAIACRNREDFGFSYVRDSA